MIIKKIDLIGNTPLVLLEHYSKIYKCDIYVKLEKYNLTYSSKDRAVKQMLLDALNTKTINENSTIIEATSGNTGISLACICNILKLKCIIVCPENISEERKQLLNIYNAKVIYTSEQGGMNEALKKAKRLSKTIKNSFLLDQFNNINNTNSHYEFTSKEILDDLPEIQCFCASYGTSGTIMGIAKALKEKKENIKVIAAVPDNKKHRVEGIFSNISSSLHDKTYIDEVIKVSDVDAYNMQKELIINEGLFLGLSSSLAISSSLKYLKNVKCDNMVIFCPDGGERYLSNKFIYNKNISKEEIKKDIDYIYSNLFKSKDFIFDDVFFKYNISSNNVLTIKNMLIKDAIAINNIDPSSNSVSDVIEIYNSFFAILCYRFAHFIYNNYCRKIGRIISEYAHEKTAIDIHPEAKIKQGFAIDHGVGVVIGQTSYIGKNVTLYHGVTLGAKSVKNKKELVNVKRHPTILNNVTIYANSSILGGKTIIGNNCIIGANKLIYSSLKDNSIIK